MLHPSTFDYINPSAKQVDAMMLARAAAKAYSDVLEQLLPDGPDKTFILRTHRTVAMWANVTITRHPDGAPRQEHTGTD